MHRTGMIIGLIFLVFTVAGCVSTININDDPYYRGEAAQRKGDYQNAIKDFNIAIKTNHTMGSLVYNELGDAYFKNGNYRDALNAYKQYLNLTYTDPVRKDMVKFYDENPQWRGGAAVKIRRSYQVLKNSGDAVSFMEQLIAKDQSNSYYFRELGYIYMMIGQYDKAITATKRAIEMNPQDPYSYDNLGYVYGKKKQYDKAFKAFRKSIEINPQNHAACSNYGRFLVEKRDYAEATEQYKKAVSLRPNNRAYLSGLTGAYYKQGKYDEALDVVNINLSTFTGIGAEIEIDHVYAAKYPVIKGTSESGPAKKAGLLIGDGIIKIDGEETKDFTIAKAVRGLRGEEGTPIVLTIKRKERYKEAAKTLEKTVTRERRITAAASTGTGYRSIIRRQMGEQEGALKDAKQAYSLDSSDTLAQLSLGASNLDQGRYDESIRRLSVVKDNSTARVLEATAYAKQGDFKKAVGAYSAIPEEKLSPKNVPLWSDRAALLKAMRPFIASKMENTGRLKAQGRQKEALNELGDALKVADDKTSKEICGSIYRIMSMNPQLSELPEEARKYALRGDVLTEEGKFDKAVNEYRQAIQAAPYIAKLYFNTGMIYGELKKYSQAIRYMKTYLNLAPEAPNVRATQDQIYKWEFMLEKKK